MPRVWSILSLILLGAPATARADIGVDDFSPQYERQLLGLDDFSFDSDWFPKSGPVQLRLMAHAGNSVAISMPGEGHYDWDEQAIRFLGAPEAGSLRFDIGLQLDAKVRFDVLGLKWESDIIGPYDYAVIAEDFYTPYLLPGNLERPVVIDDETDPVTVVAVPVTPDILVAAGNLNIDVYAILHGSLAGQRIEASADDPLATIATVTEEGALASLPAGAGPLPDPFAVDGVLVCAFSATPTFVLKPTLVMEILGQEYEIADIEIPIELPPFDETIRFDAITMSFPRPPAPEPTTSGGDSEGESHGMTGGVDEPTTGGAPATDGAGEGPASTSDTDDAATAGHAPGGEDGCGCRSDSGPGALALLALLGLAVPRRRARSR